MLALVVKGTGSNLLLHTCPGQHFIVAHVPQSGRKKIQCIKNAQKLVLCSRQKRQRRLVLSLLWMSMFNQKVCLLFTIFLLLFLASSAPTHKLDTIGESQTWGSTYKPGIRWWLRGRPCVKDRHWGVRRGEEGFDLTAQWLFHFFHLKQSHVLSDRHWQVHKSISPYLTVWSSLAVAKMGFFGWVAKAHNSPSAWPWTRHRGLSRLLTCTSKISLSCVPISTWSPRQHTLRTHRPATQKAL